MRLISSAHQFTSFAIKSNAASKIEQQQKTGNQTNKKFTNSTSVRKKWHYVYINCIDFSSSWCLLDVYWFVCLFECSCFFLLANFIFTNIWNSRFFRSWSATFWFSHFWLLIFDLWKWMGFSTNSNLFHHEHDIKIGLWRCINIYRVFEYANLCRCS